MAYAKLGLSLLSTGLVITDEEPCCGEVGAPMAAFADHQLDEALKWMRDAMTVAFEDRADDQEMAKARRERADLEPPPEA